MNKYLLKQEYIGCEIHTRTSDGTEILITDKIFNDYFAEVMIANGQHHLVRVNPLWMTENQEKKSYVQISENVISLTSPYRQVEEIEQKNIVEKQDLKPKGGKQQKKTK